MRLTTVGVLLLVLVSFHAPIALAEDVHLLRVVSVLYPAGIQLAAYEDGQVWWSTGGNPPAATRVETINRPLPIRQLVSFIGYDLLILYEDDQVWYWSHSTEEFRLWVDLRRDGTSVTSVACFSSDPHLMLISYANGQVWTFYETNGTWTRCPWMERASFTASSDDDSRPSLPSTSTLRPSPFAGSCEISARIEAAGRVLVRVFDSAGRCVRVLADEERSAGVFGIEWDGKDDAGNRLPSGIYMTRIETRAGVTTGKAVLAH